ncbi:hypothetical protein [Halomarina oriensis]|uniref:Uncharacterized protein n=1 Tax=Halomarina oriensis TaxID=671145 RepID=A0A6B0GVP9_9EURY|nr:hypothetical protein [Halomarina oriensis]MWG36663.1 hypothetical protein [Halomarina oriensis]
MRRRLGRWGKNNPRIGASVGLLLGVALLVAETPVVLWWFPLGFGLSVTAGLVARRALGWGGSGDDPLTGRGGGITIVLFTLAMVVEMLLLDVPLDPLATVESGTDTMPVGFLWLCLLVMFVVGLLRFVDTEVPFLTTNPLRDDSR